MIIIIIIIVMIVIILIIVIIVIISTTKLIIPTILIMIIILLRCSRFAQLVPAAGAGSRSWCPRWNAKYRVLERDVPGALP